MIQRVHDGIKVGAKACRIDARRAPRGARDDRARDKSARGNRPKLGNRRSISRHGHGLATLHFTQNGSGVVAKFALSDRTTHVLIVAAVALCSNTSAKRLTHDEERAGLVALHEAADPVLSALWKNDADAVYDEL